MSDEERKQIADLSKGMKLKEGERIVGPTRRPDGTLRKAIRIRAGYNPQDEVAIYQTKGARARALLNKEMMGSSGPPGYDPDAADSKPKTKSVKRNERKKEKRVQASLDKDKNAQAQEGEEKETGKDEPVQALTSQVNDLALQDSVLAPPAPDIDKRIRALKKKIRVTEALDQKSAEQNLQPEQLEKLAKLEDWRRELKQLEDEKGEPVS